MFLYLDQKVPYFCSCSRVCIRISRFDGSWVALPTVTVQRFVVNVEKHNNYLLLHRTLRLTFDSNAMKGSLTNAKVLPIESSQSMPQRIIKQSLLGMSNDHAWSTSNKAQACKEVVSSFSREQIMVTEPTFLKGNCGIQPHPTISSFRFCFLARHGSLPIP